MIYRRLDANKDYSFGQNRQDFISKVDAVAQAIYTRLYLLYSEWWEDQQDGLPLWQSILGTRISNKKALDLLIQERILGTNNVKDIQYFTSSFDRDKREYTFQCVVNTAFGQVTVGNVQGQITTQGVS